MRRLAATAVMLLGLMINAGAAWAHSDSATDVDRATASAPGEATRALGSLTQRLLDLHAEHQRATDGDARRAVLRVLASVAAARQQRLAALVEDDPGAVLRAAIAARVRAALPPEILRYVEEDVTLEGELDVLHADAGAGARYYHWLKLGQSRLSLNFAALAPALASGDRVRVRGLRVLQALAVGGTGAVTVQAAAAVPNTFGAQKTAVLLVSFSDAPGVASASPAQAQDVVFGTGASVSSFFYETSYQQTWLTGQVFGPYVISISGAGTSCDYYGISQAAEQAAAAAGVNLSTFSRRVYAFPQNSCPWWGLGSVGGSPSRAWINGSFQNTVVAHEMGHNLGLYHSHALECGSATVAASCSSVEYGDVLDTMGSATPPKHYNAAQKDRLGWLGYGASPPITTVTSSGVYTIDPYEAPGTGSKALKVRTAAGDWYYVEYRQPFGFDASSVSTNANVKNGVVVHLMDNGDPNGIYLLDMTPATSSWWDPALGVSQTFVDSAAGLSITPQWVNGTNAGVSITLGPTECTRQKPTVQVSPAQQQGAAGTAVAYTVAVTNNDTGCGASTFNPSATVPSGWTASFGATALSIDAGGTASTTLSVKSAASAAPGLYGIAPTATNASAPAYAASGSASYSVPSACARQNPTVKVSPAEQQGAPGLAVTYTVSVTNNDAGCTATSFAQTAALPSGWTGSFAAPTLTINAGATSTTTLSVKAPATAAPGSYGVQARATSAALSTYTAAAPATYAVPLACVRKAPTVAIAPAQQSGGAGAALTYTVSVTNNDASCAASGFALSANLPVDWTAAYGTASLNLSPGATATTTLKVTSPASAAAGTVAIVATAVNAGVTGYSGKASGAYSVLTPGGGDTGVPVETFTDDFARADSPTLGNGWVEVKGDLSIAAGQLRSGPTRALHMAVLPDVAGARQRAAATFASADNNYSPRFGVLVRYRDARNYYMCYRLTGGTSVLRISKVVNGLEIVLKSMPIGNPARDAMFSVGCRAEGTTLTLELDGVAKLTASDATFASGAVGLVIGPTWLLGGAGPSHRADHFTATLLQ